MNFSSLASVDDVQKTRAGLIGRGYEVFVVKNKAEALEKIKEIVPAGAAVMSGASVTLEQIGFVDYLAGGKHGWTDWNAKIKDEDDKEKRAKLRRESVMSDYYLGSVHALAESGEFVIASNTGSQLPHIVYTSHNLVFVVSTKKIVPDLAMAMKRLEEYVVPLEDKHMQDLYKVHTAMNKVVVFRGEAPMTGRKVKFVLVSEDLGF